ncbi:MAG: hypothetical protein HYZ15_16690 [Sphingobacteriales bacterium]|nr:hypothetical protein [Sphingobacteriales bacterium]
MKTWLFLLLFLSGSPFIFSQDCRVLTDSLKGTYSGGCKNGLADGEGTATGTDRYTGHFKKGVPYGSGRYTWKNGDWYEGEWKDGKPDGPGTRSRKNNNGKEQPEILTGFFKDGEYRGKYEKPYEMEMLTNNFTSISIKKMNNLVPEISLVVKNTTAGGSTFKMPMLPKSQLRDIQLIEGNYTELVSDTSSKITNRYVIRHIRFPFRAVFTFERDQSAQQLAQARIELNEEGNWMIKVDVEQ